MTREGKTWRVNFDIVPDGEKFKALGEFVDVGAVDRDFTVEAGGGHGQTHPRAAERDGDNFRRFALGR